MIRRVPVIPTRPASGTISSAGRTTMRSIGRRPKRPTRWWALGVPDGADSAVESRRLLQRMVDYMLGQGVRQFLDLGSGLPNMANTHQVAHRAAPEARIVYVDNDPLVSTYAAALMAGPSVVTLRADLREPEQVLSDPQVRD